MADLGVIGTYFPRPNPGVVGATQSANGHFPTISGGLQGMVTDVSPQRSIDYGLGAQSQLGGMSYFRKIDYSRGDDMIANMWNVGDPSGVKNLQTPQRLIVGEDFTVGTPSPPSQKHGRPGIYKTVYVPVTAGFRTISISVLYASPGTIVEPTPYPRLRVKANPDVGLNNDLIADAVQSTTWQTLSVTFTAKAAGIVEVWREKRYPGEDDAIWWDNLFVS